MLHARYAFNRATVGKTPQKPAPPKPLTVADFEIKEDTKGETEFSKAVAQLKVPPEGLTIYEVTPEIRNERRKSARNGFLGAIACWALVAFLWGVDFEYYLPNPRKKQPESEPENVSSWLSLLTRQEIVKISIAMIIVFIGMSRYSRYSGVRRTVDTLRLVPANNSGHASPSHLVVIFAPPFRGYLGLALTHANDSGPVNKIRPEGLFGRLGFFSLPKGDDIVNIEVRPDATRFPHVIPKLCKRQNDRDVDSFKNTLLQFQQTKSRPK